MARAFNLPIKPCLIECLYTWRAPTDGALLNFSSFLVFSQVRVTLDSCHIPDGVSAVKFLRLNN